MKVTDDKLAQSAKRPLPRVVTELGKVIDERLVHWLNAQFPILATLFPMDMLVMPVQ